MALPTFSTFCRISGILCWSLLLSSCIVTRHPAGIAPSTAPVTSTYTVLGPVEESDCVYRLLIIPFGGKDDEQEMIDRLTKAKGADALIGVTVEHMNSMFALPLVGQNCTVIAGTAVKNAR